MPSYRGHKWPTARRYDRIGIFSDKDFLFISAYSGEHRHVTYAGVNSKTARKIAAELIIRADAIDHPEGE